MNGTPRTPPRFVPTLTAVLEPEAASAPAEAAEPAAPAPPPAVPDLRSAVALDPHQRISEAEAFRLEEQLLHRVLQRVDLSLEERLSDAVAAAVQVQLDAMVPRLRDEIETVLRALVVDALAQELSENGAAAGASGPASLG